MLIIPKKCSRLEYTSYTYPYFSFRFDIQLEGLELSKFKFNINDTYQIS